MVEILQSAFIEALGWSLVDSLWHTGALWGLYNIVTLNSRRYSASIRHNLAFGALIISTILFFTILFINYRSVIHDNHPYSLSYFIYQPLEKAWDFDVYPDAIVSLMSSAYLVMVLFNCSKLIFQYSSGNFLKKELLPASETITRQVSWLSRKMKTGKQISVWLSKKIITPLTIGIIKPVILLPATLVTQLNALQLEAVIVHELNHIRRNDYLLNLFLVFTEAIMYFNPFALILSSIVRNERENSCDDKVLQMGYDAWNYSQALYIISSQTTRIDNKLILAATGSRKKVLLSRIKRMMQISQPSPSFIKPAAAFFLCLAVAILNVRDNREKSAESKSNSTRLVNTSLLLYRPEPVVIQEIKIEKVKVFIVPGEKKITSEVQSTVALSGQESGADEDANVGEYFAAPIFITNQKELEFTIIVPELPDIPQPVARETPMPYVPGSTFYYPVDSLNIKGSSGEIIRI